MRKHVGWWTAFGGCAFLVSLALAWAAVSRWAFLGFLAAFAWIGAVACWTPLAIVVFECVATWLLRGISHVEPWKVAFRNLTRSLHRSSVAAILLTVAFAMMIGTSIMIDSFRSTVDYWIHQTVRADLYLTTLGNLRLHGGESLPPALVSKVRALPGVRDVDTYHEIWIDAADAGETAERKIKLAAIDFRIIDRYRHLHFKGAVFAKMDRLRVLVNESFSTRFRKKAGNHMLLQTPSGPVEAIIGGVFYDYSTDSGLVLLDQPDYARLWNDARIYSLALYLDDPSHAPALRQKIETELAGEAKLALFLNSELRREVLRVFDQTFAITLSLRAVTVIVAAGGLFLVLMTLIAERGREVALLRALGMTPRQIMSMMLVESGALGVLGWVMGTIGGIGLSWILAFVINRAYFGWTIQWRLDPWLLVISLLMALPAALLAGLFSGIKATKTSVVAALRYE